MNNSTTSIKKASAEWKHTETIRQGWGGEQPSRDPALHQLNPVAESWGEMVERARQEMGAKGVPAVPKSILQLMAWNISTLTFSFTIMTRWQWPWDRLGRSPSTSTRPLLRRMKPEHIWIIWTFGSQISDFLAEHPKYTASNWGNWLHSSKLCVYVTTEKALGLRLPKQSFASAYYRQVCFFFFPRAQHFSNWGFQPEMGSQNLFSGVTSSGQPCAYSR